MLLLVDIGNTAVKWALCDDDRNVRFGDVLDDNGWRGIVERNKVDRALISCTGGSLAKHTASLEKLGVSVSVVDADLQLPITIDYATPETLGPDRIAAACGAFARCHTACVIVDAGTCVTVDYVDQMGFYHGGAIMPGVGMQLQAMNHFTSRLPMVCWEQAEACYQLGRITSESMLGGAVWGTLYAIEGFVRYYKATYRVEHVFVTGGDGHALCKMSQLGLFCPLLVFEGMATMRGY